MSEPTFCGELGPGGATLNQCVKDVDVLGRDCNQKNAILVPGKAGQSERASTAKTGSITWAVLHHQSLVVRCAGSYLLFLLLNRDFRVFCLPSPPFNASDMRLSTLICSID